MNSTDLLKFLAQVQVKADTTIHELIFKIMWPALVADCRTQGNAALLDIAFNLSKVLGFQSRKRHEPKTLTCSKWHTFGAFAMVEEIIEIQANPEQITHTVYFENDDPSSLVSLFEKNEYTYDGKGKFSRDLTNHGINLFDFILTQNYPLYDELKKTA